MRLSQLELVTDILRAIEKQSPKATIDMTLLNVICEAAIDIVNEADRKRVYAKHGMGIKAWLASDDTGLSSRFMAAVLAGFFDLPENHHPHDVADFGRCVRMLDAAPELRPRMGMMEKCGPVWSRFIDEWGKLEGMYRKIIKTKAKFSPELYAAIQRIEQAGRATQPVPTEWRVE
jgi:hypothetical protein